MGKTYRVLVTGSRDWEDFQAVFDALAACNNYGHITLVHGDCPSGADFMASIAALSFGWEVEPYPADWGRHGKPAGFRRNAEMVALGADVCLAFIKDGSRGASHCADLAEKAGIETRRITCGETRARAAGEGKP